MNKIKTSDNTICYFTKINGINKLHSFEHPAYIPQGDKSKAEYYIYGIKVSKEVWEIKKKELNNDID